MSPPPDQQEMNVASIVAAWAIGLAATAGAVVFGVVAVATVMLGEVAIDRAIPAIALGVVAVAVGLQALGARHAGVPERYIAADGPGGLVFGAVAVTVALYVTVSLAAGYEQVSGAAVICGFAAALCVRSADLTSQSIRRGQTREPGEDGSCETHRPRRAARREAGSPGARRRPRRRDHLPPGRAARRAPGRLSDRADTSRRRAGRSRPGPRARPDRRALPPRATDRHGAPRSDRSADDRLEQRPLPRGRMRGRALRDGALRRLGRRAVHHARHHKPRSTSMSHPTADRRDRPPAGPAADPRRPAAPLRQRRPARCRLGTEPARAR